MTVHGHTGVPETDLVLAVARALRRSAGDGLAALDLTPHEARALRAVAGHGHVGGRGHDAGHARPAPDGEPDPASDVEPQSAPDGAPSPAPRLADIAAALRIAPRSATEVIDRLQDRGLVQRRPSVTDRRAVEVVPTAAGRAVLVEVERVWRTSAESFLAPLDRDERTTLAVLLRRLLPEDRRA
ncbi:MAG TPA: MarR family transcriptional regulator [Micrococcales bacterium]|uniref:MarR family winged helix-turn-helix transcriptional regulator n=1 Tax=Miniimonas arenae TaxID=676201 RepID=UPI000EDF8613|nr:MarR family winged helix-turn-helix transcriptional regulator [Miniimonas arenae]HCX84154.1 MarR family transcriptional regulator [Micrococcales bacterium]